MSGKMAKEKHPDPDLTLRSGPKERIAPKSRPGPRNRILPIPAFALRSGHRIPSIPQNEISPELAPESDYTIPPLPKLAPRSSHKNSTNSRLPWKALPHPKALYKTSSQFPAASS